MATKKAAEEVKEEVLAEEAAAEPVEQKDPWAEMVDMYIPKKRGDDPQFYVCVNDRRFAIPADGKVQKLPKPIATILQDSLQAEDAAEDFAASLEVKEPREQL